MKRTCLWVFWAATCASLWMTNGVARADETLSKSQTHAETAASTTEISGTAVTDPRPNNSNSAGTATVTPAAVANANQPAGTNPSTAAEQHRLAIGDRLSFRIVEDQDWTNASLFVTDSGELEVPYIGRIPAQNKTCKQLATEIKTALEKDYYYQATVILSLDLMSRTRGRVYLVGAVRGPGPVDLLSDETVTLSKAILRAGGFTDFADRRHVKVTRQGTTEKGAKETFIVDVGEIFDKGKVETDLTLESGDLIYIPNRLVRF